MAWNPTPEIQDESTTGPVSAEPRTCPTRRDGLRQHGSVNK